MSGDLTVDRTAAAALDKFTLLRSSAGDGEKTACTMTLLAWVAGEAWTDHPPCAARLLANWAVAANDHPDTTDAQRRALVLAGETGIIDTWWIPDIVLIDFWRRADGAGADKIIDVVNRVSAWKEQTSGRERPDLRGAVLRGADLRDAYRPFGAVEGWRANPTTGRLELEVKA